ncbi:hypothetical protein C9426_22085 [Serratia sp. S1B]|nr:hypothetical protein C9426_22085 [Serratia sp. S1B]
MLQSNSYTYDLPIPLPPDGCTIVYTRHGIITAAEVMRADQFVGTIRSFMEIAESLGYTFIGNKIS